MSPALVATPASPQSMMSITNEHPVESQYQKGVKHLYEIGIRRVPLKYILPVSERPNQTHWKTHTTDGSLQLPVIDLSGLHGPRRSQVVRSLASACENYGFFQVVNHGIPNEVISNMMDVTKRFFELPSAEREKYMSADMSKPVRYGTSFNQLKDSVFCWRDFLKLVCNPLEDVLSHWPSSPMDLRGLAVTYAKETKFLYLMILEAILESLGLTTTKNTTADTDDQILSELKDGSQQMFLNFYPPCPEPDLTFGLRSHSDFGILTLLLQDEVAGLQIKHQGRWLAVEPIPGSFVVNVGDQLEIFSNGRYKSVLHRVVVNSSMSRISVASLHSLPSQSAVRPAEKLINQTNPRRYRDTDIAAFLHHIKSCDYQEKGVLESRKLT
ncbi:probable 2-oxoglutarate-dependent dioxygenase SLC1 [Coffea arabica]|uniref:Probable 2-oxoglutarate-dependent dioxygenase SLC1 n=1 Tax=Coffea arabica TaxID=13443 RepID=A0A6P6SW28_COFAR